MNEQERQRLYLLQEIGACRAEMTQQVTELGKRLARLKEELSGDESVQCWSTFDVGRAATIHALCERERALRQALSFTSTPEQET